MLRNVTDFARGFLFGLLVGGSAGMLMAPASGEESKSGLQTRLEAARAAFEEGRARAEQELLDYFQQARQSSREESGP